MYLCTMTKATLHYIYDPLCGWCYGSGPLVSAARSVEGLAVVMHGGGMLAGTARQLVTPGLREFILGHVERITALTRQPFRSPFTDGLLGDPTAMLDSEPPTAAILAAQAVAGRGLDMLARMQKAHYEGGSRLVERKEFVTFATDIGLDGAGFEEQLTRMLGTIVQTHIADSRRLLARVGGQGFPTFALEANGRLETLDTSRWLGKPEEWRAALEIKVSRQTAR
jgi:putative protein-disulfide isomerase